MDIGTSKTFLKKSIIQSKSQKQFQTQMNHCMPCATTRIGAALLQSHKGTNNMNFISAVLRLFAQVKLRLSTLMRECTAIKYAPKESELLILGLKHLTVLITDHEPKVFLYTQKSNPNHRVYGFQLTLIKFPKLHIIWTAEKTLPYQSKHTT